MDDVRVRATNLRERLFAGSQFIIVNATQEQPIWLKLTERGQQTAQARAFTSPAVFSRYLYSAETDVPEWALWGDKQPDAGGQGKAPLSWPMRTISDLQQAAAVTDRKIYRPGDAVRLFVVGLMTPEAAARVSLKRAGQLVLSTDVSLNAGGLALTTLEDLDEGEYQVMVEAAGKWTADCSFSVAAYSLSLLTAALEKHTYADKTLSFEVMLRQLETPYRGEVELGLQCQVCAGRVVATKKLTVRDGKISSSFDVSGHGGPFHIQITTPDGETALVSFPSTRYDVREAIPLSTLGQQVKGGLLPGSDTVAVRGLHLSHDTVATTPFSVQNVVAERGEIQALADAGPLQFVKVNPLTGETSVLNIAHISKSQSLSVDVTAPYVVYAMGGMVQGKPFEAWGVFIRPEEIKPSLDAPKRVAPGAEITVRIETGKPAHCLLLVYDARLEHESPVPKLAERLFRHVREATTGLTTGFMESLGMTMRPRPVVFRDNELGSPLPRMQQSSRSNRMDSTLALPAFLRSAPSPARAVQAAAKGARLYFAGDAAPAEQAEAEAEAVAVASRTDFPEVVLVDMFPVEAVAERKVTLGEQIGLWRCRAYVLRGMDYVEATADVQTAKDVYVELDLPAFVAPGDEVYARARYHTPTTADLTVQTATDVQRKRVQGDGVLEIRIKGPGEVVGQITGGPGSDMMSRVVGMPGKQMVTRSRIALLKSGESVEGERVVVYPNMGMVIKETIESLIQYPFGCAEQTSSKLYGLAVAYRGIEQGIVPGDRARVHGLIMTGLQRLQAFAHSDGRFSLWEAGQPDDYVTGKVAHRLIALRGLSYDAAESMLEKSGEALARAKIKDNQLLALGAQFRDKMQTTEDAAALYAFGGNGETKQEALSFLRKTAMRGEGVAHWPAATAWGGSIETTCDATRVLYAAGDALYKEGFAYVGGRLIDGRLYSTADTRALVELLAAMNARGRRARVDGVEHTVDAPMIGRAVVALEDDVVVRVDTTAEINYLEPSAGFLFEVSVAKRKLSLGERTQVHVRLREASLCPLARVYLPANMALLKGGANAQEAHLPIIGQELVLDAVAVRRGTAKLYVTVHDMYDAQKVGTAPGVEVSVA